MHRHRHNATDPDLIGADLPEPAERDPQHISFTELAAATVVSVVAVLVIAVIVIRGAA